jgi:hypothetical protein
MKLSTLLVLLALPAAAVAGKAKHAPAVKPAAAAAQPLSVGAQVAAPEAPVLDVTPSSGALTVRLKDGQVFPAQLQKSDKYFLSFNNAKGTHFDIPWAEVEAVDSKDLGADGLALLRANLTPGPGPVGSIVEPRSGGEAFKRALWPGFLLHGSGHRYAGDNDSFVSLAGGELFGVVIGAFGLSELNGATEDGEHRGTSLALAVGGGSIFALTWFYDMAFAPGAARDFNAAKGLSLEPRPDGVQLSYKF